ncbi:MAG: hypothetical protein KA436_06730 [Oligoflexales bacterium]|nr:hypothetical protein [Oligoflexales bacterium]
MLCPHSLFSKISVFYAYFFSIFWLGSPSFAADPVSISKDAVYSKNITIFQSTWSHGYQINESLSKSMLGKYTFYGKLLDKKVFKFLCPGDSFLTEIVGSYETKVSEDKYGLADAYRRYRLACNFMEDAAEKPFEKSVCKWSDHPDNVRGAPGSSQCADGEFVGGLKATWDGREQIYSTYCCKMGRGGVFAAAKGCTTIDPATPFGQPSHLTCPAPSVIRKIETSFINQGQNGDRRMKFECCSASLP